MEKQNFQLLRLAGKILGATAVISLVILLMGYFLEWNDPVRYSNSFFTAGMIVIILGVLSVAGGFAQRANFDITYAESAGQANLAERGQRIAAENIQRYGSMIFLLATGLLLVGIAIAIGNFLITQ